MVGIKYCGDTPFKAMLIFVNYADISSTTVNSIWVGGNTNIFKSI